MQQHPQPPSREERPSYGSVLAPGLAAPRPEETVRHYSLVRDIYWGAILGEFAPTVGIPGVVVQALLGYVPVLGTITALRDVVADIRLHDGVGVILNTLAAFPVLGGLAKTADALHGLHRLHRTRSSRQQDEIKTSARKPAGLGCLAFGISIVMLTLGVFYGLGIHIATQYARVAWPLGSNTLFIGNGVLVVAIGLAALGLSLGEVICIGSRAWFGVIFLPAALYIGLLLGGTALR